jgi:pimeloyl-ACP methyl ester carboxylesterase
MKKIILYNIIILSCMSLFSSCNVTDRFFSYQQKILTKSGFTKEVYQSDSLHLSYSIGGEGEALLFIHGFGGNGDFTWSRQMKKFASHYRVIVPDLLWFGQSHSTYQPGLTAQTKAICMLLEHLGIQKVHIVGLSYGGFVCFDLQQKIPEKIASVVIVDSPGPPYKLAYLQEFLERNGANLASDIFVPENPDGLQKLIDIAMYRSFKIPQNILRELYDKEWNSYQDEQKRLLGELPENQERFKSFSQFNKSNFLVIWGEDDAVFPLKSGQELAEFLGCELISYKRCGHLAPAEKSRKFNRSLKKFLNRNQ